MDCDQVWRNPSENVTPMYLNNCSFSPTTYSEPVYNVRSESNPLVNLPCCNSPSCSGFSNIPPEPHMPNIRNKNVRHHPYQSSFSCNHETQYGPHEILPFHSVRGPYRQQINEACFSPQMNWQGTLNVDPKMFTEKTAGKTNNIKPNVRRKRQKNPNTKEVFPNCSMQCSHHQINYDESLTPNCLSKKKDLVGNNYEYGWNEIPMPTLQNYETVETYLQKEDNNDINITNNNTNMFMNNSNMSEGINVLPYAMKDSNFTSEQTHYPLLNTFNGTNETEGTNNLSTAANNTIFIPEHKNDQHMNTFSNEPNTINTNVALEDEINTNANNCQPASNLNLSDCQIAHVSVPGNSTFNVQDIQEKGAENNFDMTSFSFGPIFEAKDENGEDIVILMANSNMQQFINEENKSDTLHYNQRIETQDNIAILNQHSESVAVSNESTLEPGLNEAPNKQCGNLIFSRIDDFGSEEVVTTSKRKCPKTKTFNRKIEKSTDGNLVLTINQRTSENHTVDGFPNMPSTSTKEINTSEYPAENVNHSHKIYRRKRPFFRQRMPAWKRRLGWRSNEPIMNIKRKYLNLFIRRVKLENEHSMISESFWNMYRTVVTQIGGNMLQTMYNILPALVRNYEANVQRSNESSSNLITKRLRVKLPAQKKK